MLLLGKGNAAEETFPTARGELRVLFGVRAAPGFPGCAPLTTELGRARQIKSCSDKFWRSWSKHRSLSCLVLGCSPLLRPRHLLSTAGQEEIPAAIPAGAARDGPQHLEASSAPNSSAGRFCFGPLSMAALGAQRGSGGEFISPAARENRGFSGGLGGQGRVGIALCEVLPQPRWDVGPLQARWAKGVWEGIRAAKSLGFFKIFFPLHLCPLDSGRNGLRPGFDVLKQTVPSPPPPVPKL